MAKLTMLIHDNYAHIIRFIMIISSIIFYCCYYIYIYTRTVVALLQVFQAHP